MAPKASKPKFVIYLRVSTDKQGATGLGMEAQREGITSFVQRQGGIIVGEFIEVETGKRDDRPQLAAALKACRVHRATLAVYKLDRLARKVSFISTIMDSSVEFVCTTMPQVNRLTLHILAAVAEQEAADISQRTKDGLRSAKARGIKLGRPENLSNAALGQQVSLIVRRKRADTRADDVIDSIEFEKTNGATTLREIAAGLNARDIPTVSGKGAWSAMSVKRVLDRSATV